MAPKKKAPRPSVAASIPAEDVPEGPTEESTEDQIGEQLMTDDVDKPQPQGVSDSWTNEQETLLFKSIIRCKPVGMHKHFRMLNISNLMRAHRCDGYSAPQYRHTKIPGIWEKLRGLYNLEILDAREDAIGDRFYEFELPNMPSGGNEGYFDLKFAKAIDPDGPTSPPIFPWQLTTAAVEIGQLVVRGSTVDDTDDPRSSPASIAGSWRGRGTRGGRGKGGSRLAEVSTRGGRQSKTTPENDASEDDEKSDQDDEDAMDVNDEGSEVTAAKTATKGGKSGAARGFIRKSGRKR
ncbi:hypothetical protein MMC21_006213 [Puttea exsequens]|nr:hypothetical protein [Puttea exsequens]